MIARLAAAVWNGPILKEIRELAQAEQRLQHATMADLVPDTAGNDVATGACESSVSR